MTNTRSAIMETESKGPRGGETPGGHGRNLVGGIDVPDCTRRRMRVDPDAPGSAAVHPTDRRMSVSFRGPGLGVLSAVLYRFYDADDRLLYIGVTTRPLTRFTAHRRKAQWWAIADHVTTEQLPSMWEALAAEVAAIKSERPAYNRRSVRRGS